MQVVVPGIRDEDSSLRLIGDLEEPTPVPDRNDPILLSVNDQEWTVDPSDPGLVVELVAARLQILQERAVRRGITLMPPNSVRCFSRSSTLSFSSSKGSAKSLIQWPRRET